MNPEPRYPVLSAHVSGSSSPPCPTSDRPPSPFSMFLGCPELSIRLFSGYPQPLVCTATRRSPGWADHVFRGPTHPPLLLVAALHLAGSHRFFPNSISPSVLLLEAVGEGSTMTYYNSNPLFFPLSLPFRILMIFEESLPFPALQATQLSLRWTLQRGCDISLSFPLVAPLPHDPRRFTKSPRALPRLLAHHELSPDPLRDEESIVLGVSRWPPTEFLL